MQRKFRLDRLKQAAVAPQDEKKRDIRIASMSRAIEHLKILADSNDPLVKKRFEDGEGELNHSLEHARTTDGPSQATCLSPSTGILREGFPRIWKGSGENRLASRSNRKRLCTRDIYQWIPHRRRAV